MFAILGAAGKIGFATSTALRAAGMPVRAILHDESKAAPLLEIGCEVAVADLQNPEALAEAIGDADALQIILPPSPQAADPAGEMRKGIASLGSALEKANTKRVLAISDYGAHVTHDIGMPSIFHVLEQRLAQLQGHKLFLRSAEHMQGWGRAIPTAITTGALISFHSPADMLFPTISAPDVGLIAADLLLRPVAGQGIEIVHAEGPERYCANDVAAAVSELAGQTISLHLPPRSEWRSIFGKSMNASLVELLIRANDAQNQGGVVDVEPKSGQVCRGRTTLVDALRELPALKKAHIGSSAA